MLLERFIPLQNEIGQQTTPVATEEVAQSTLPPLDHRLVWIMAVACALSVANLYYIQPILANMGQTFHVSVNQMGFIATLTQLGYATGLLLIVPLGDRYNRRSLIVGMLIVVTIALVLVATAPTITMLAISAFAVGVTTVVPQIIIPLSASLAAPSERGRVVGTVMSGLLIGVLLARTVSGAVGAYLGWRTMYWIAAAMMVLLALVLRFLLPENRSHTTMNYWQLLRSIGYLVRTEPTLREASLFGGLAFGAFSAFWVTLAFFLQGSPYHYGSAVAGLFGLVGVGGASAASFVGRLTDRFEARYTVGGALLFILAAFVCMWLAGYWLWGLIIGVILLDLGTQSNQVSNQARIYSLHPEARSRLNTVFMVAYFIGGSLGSYLGTLGWSLAGWNGVCGVGCLLVVLALVVYGVNGKHKQSMVRE